MKEVFAEGFGHNASKMKEGVEEGKKRGGNAKPATANAMRWHSRSPGDLANGN